MNLKIAIIAAVLLLAAGAGGYFFFVSVYVPEDPVPDISAPLPKRQESEKPIDKGTKKAKPEKPRMPKLPAVQNREELRHT